MKTPNTKEKILSKEKQKKKLTTKEKEAWEIILNNMRSNRKDNISILGLVKNSNISRPVFNNVLLKLQSNNEIIVENQGVKGTHIEILNADLWKSSEE